MKRITMILLAVSCLWGSCSKDDSEDVFASGKTPNWREVKDEPGEINQLRYKIYKEYDVSIAVTDTLGKIFRGFDRNGDSIIHYEVIPVGFTMVGNESTMTGRTLSRDQQALLKALELMEKYVVKRLPKESIYRPYVYLLCDSAYYEYNTFYGKYHYPSYTITSTIMCLDVGQVGKLLEMNEYEQRFWAGMILAQSHYSSMRNIYEEELKVFFDLGVDSQGRSLYFKEVNYTNGIIPETRDEEIRLQGFFMDRYRGPYDNAMEIFKNWKKVVYIDPLLDLQTYIATVYAFEEDEFISMLGDTEKYSLILQKYRIIKELVQKFRTEVAP